MPAPRGYANGRAEIDVLLEASDESLLSDAEWDLVDKQFGALNGDDDFELGAEFVSSMSSFAGGARAAASQADARRGHAGRSSRALAASSASAFSTATARKPPWPSSSWDSRRLSTPMTLAAISSSCRP